MTTEIPHKVQIYNPAKTIADCFKFRNKIGLDIAIAGKKFLIEPENKPAEWIATFPVIICDGVD